MAKFFAAADADPAILNGKTIAVIGYGNQGRSQAINLRRSGHQVIVGNQEDESWRQAREDGFETFAMDAAAARADVVMLLLPDEIAPATYRELIAPHLARGVKRWSSPAATTLPTSSSRRRAKPTWCWSRRA